MIEELYLEYQKQACEDSETLADLQHLLEGKLVLMIGPGKTCKTEIDKILNFAEKEHPFVISINYITEKLRPDAVFLTNSRRYLQMSNKLRNPENKNLPLIVTSNIRLVDEKNVRTVNYAQLIDETAEFPDNSMMMMIRLLLNVGVKKIALAGFDGYTADNVNFFDVNMEYSFVKAKADSLNESGRAFFENIKDQINILFITTSHYGG